MKLKICGMKHPDNILEVAEEMPDYMGFIFYPESPRYVGKIFDLPEIPKQIKKVGVFVNEDLHEIKRIADYYRLDFLQLHGQESAKDCDELKKVAGVIKAFAIDPSFDFNSTREYKSSVDYFLFDAKGKYAGGNGKTFDWRQLEAYDQQVPFFLSGGLAPENMEQLFPLKAMSLHALDINSGVEIIPGLKDVQKIKNFNTKLKQLSHELQS